MVAKRKRAHLHSGEFVIFAPLYYKLVAVLKNNFGDKKNAKTSILKFNIMLLIITIWRENKKLPRPGPLEIWHPGQDATAIAQLFYLKNILRHILITVLFLFVI